MPPSEKITKIKIDSMPPIKIVGNKTIIINLIITSLAVIVSLFSLCISYQNANPKSEIFVSEFTISLPDSGSFDTNPQYLFNVTVSNKGNKAANIKSIQFIINDPGEGYINVNPLLTALNRKIEPQDAPSISIKVETTKPLPISETMAKPDSLMSKTQEGQMAFKLDRKIMVDIRVYGQDDQEITGGWREVDKISTK